MTLSNFKVNKQEIEFYSFTGEVLSQNKYSETHVWSSGGGGHIGPRGGHVAASQAHSSVTTKQEFWLKLDDGTEKSVQLGGYDIPLRESQKISILMAQTETSEGAYYAALINHASGITHEILSASSILDKLIDFYPNAYKFILWYFTKLTLIIVALVYLNMHHNVGTGFHQNIAVMLIIAIIYTLIRGLSSVLSDPSLKFVKPLTEHISNITAKLAQH